ncbi:MAG: hypothetical protein FD135_865 [Comamonadaceae bacterium]|nr:MAG: hypothetical protein FD135_865 [Comamonadaceae bacterium]
MHITLKQLSLALAGAGLLSLHGCGGGSGDTTTATQAAAGSPTVTTPPTALELATAFLKQVDASRATAVPTTGSANEAFTDGCYLGDGMTKALAIASFDANVAQAVEGRKFVIGSTRTNVQVLAERNTTNADGSSRRELDIQYQVNYADGTVDKVVKDTLISGSSVGSNMGAGVTCTTPESSSSLRYFGNRAVVSAGLRSVNQRSERYSLATGAPLTSAVDYNKVVQLRISDPGKVAKYAVVTGPGLPSAGVKMLSPRIQRDDPLFAGKRGNFVDWLDTDLFTICRSATSSRPAANLADCATSGASSNNFGAFNLSATATDTTFDAMGFVAGGSYSVALYNDDGWKTVNGQATQTPIATYTRTLGSLPYSAVALASSGVNADLFPRITSSLTPVEQATQVRNKTASTMNLSWTALGVMPDVAKFGWGSISSFVSGLASAGPATWPGSRQSASSYPAAGTTTISNYTVSAPSSLLVTPTYGEVSVYLVDRNGVAISSTRTFE